MFVSSVGVLFKKANLKLVTEDGLVSRVAETTFVLDPFPPELAHELGEDIAGHLFTEDDAIREELDQIAVRVSAGLQLVTARRHSELKPIAELKAVRVLSAKVDRHDDEKTGRSWLTLAFVLSFTLDDKAARSFVLDTFGSYLLLSFQRMQEDLLEEPKGEVRRAVKSLQKLAGDDNATITMGMVDPKTGKVEKGVTITKDDVKSFEAPARG